MTETLLAMALVVALRCFVCEFDLVKGRSMLSALHDRDVLFVLKTGHARRSLQRFDIVICHYPNRRRKRFPRVRQRFVKRVVGLPGERIAMEDGVLLVNGLPVRQPFLDPARMRFRRSFPERTLGETEYFVLGDNRDASSDSRSVGPIDERMLVGRAVLRLWPHPRRLRRLQFPD